MPILKNAKKALRVSKRKTVINSRVKSKMRTAVKQMGKAPSADSLRAAYSSIDKAVKNKLVKKNKAARMKSQLSKLAKPEKKAVVATKPAAKTAPKAAPKAAPKKEVAKKAAPVKKAVAKTSKTKSAK